MTLTRIELEELKRRVDMLSNIETVDLHTKPMNDLISLVKIMDKTLKDVQDALGNMEMKKVKL